MNPGGSAQDGIVVRVLGVGNVLWADEGFGVRCVEVLGADWEFPDSVELIDGGTLGLALIPLLQEATHVLLFDAVDHSGEPGSLIVARDDEVPRFMARDKMSLHQASMNDILAALEMLGHKPAAFTVVGVKPVELSDYGGSLTPPVRAQVPRAIEIGLEELAAWGVVPRRRTAGTDDVAMAGALKMQRYETERPGEEIAWRRGDARFFARHAGAAEVDGEDEGK